MVSIECCFNRILFSNSIGIATFSIKCRMNFRNGVELWFACVCQSDQYMFQRNWKIQNVKLYEKKLFFLRNPKASNQPLLTLLFE